jgi:hypothetical protein
MDITSPARAEILRLVENSVPSVEKKFWDLVDKNQSRLDR